MYVLVNSDGTINYADNHPLDENLYIDDTITLYEFPDHELQEKIDEDVTHPHFTVWDKEREMIARDVEFYNRVEKGWAYDRLRKIRDKMQDQMIAAQFSIGVQLAAEDNTNMLEDYQALTDYFNKDDFTGQVRPKLKTL